MKHCIIQFIYTYLVIQYSIEYARIILRIVNNYHIIYAEIIH